MVLLSVIFFFFFDPSDHGPALFARACSSLSIQKTNEKMFVFISLYCALCSLWFCSCWQDDYSLTLVVNAKEKMETNILFSRVLSCTEQTVSWLLQTEKNLFNYPCLLSPALLCAQSSCSRETQHVQMPRAFFFCLTRHSMGLHSMFTDVTKRY